MMIRFLILILFTLSAEASDLELYAKCYAQLVRSPLPLNDSNIEAIKNKSLSPKKACLNLLSLADLTENKEVTNLVGQKVLRTFQSFHNNWFPYFDFNQTTQDHPNTNVFDKNESAYHLSYALFNDQIKYSEIFTSNYRLQAMRQGASKNKFTNDKDIGGTRYAFDDPNRKWIVGGTNENDYEYQKEYTYRPELTPFGKLTGLLRVDQEVDSFSRIKKGKKTAKVWLKKPLFKGAMGSASYFILNAGHDNKTTDGGLRLHRRWSTSFLSDFLCRDNPYLRDTDAKSSVKKNSKIAFRTEKTCMNCHLTIDSLAAVTRAIEVFNAGEHWDPYFTFRAAEVHKSTHSKKSGLPDADLDFFKRPPEGALIFRSTSGKLINKKISHPDQLGLIISKLDAPYQCAAKRYFHFFTGVEVPLYDFENFKVNTDSTSKLKYRKFVLKLGSELKQHQSLKKMVASIIDSPFYKGGIHE